MSDSDPVARRTVVRTAGFAAATAALAGCIDERSVDDPDRSIGEGSPSSDEQDPSDDGDADDEPIPIELRATTISWEVLAPSEFEGAENPTLVLERGATYRLGWTEGDGQIHNIELRDANGDVVDDLSTEVTDEPDEGQPLEFEASDEMAAYACEPHHNMRGDIRVEETGDREPEILDGDESADDDRDRDPADEAERSERDVVYEIEPGTRITLSGWTAYWEGEEPVMVDGVENPSLVLTEGGHYEIGWGEGDGNYHNIEIRDENGDVIDDLSTEVTGDPDDQFLSFAASSEMAAYVCAPHENTMRGEILISG